MIHIDNACACVKSFERGWFINGRDLLIRSDFFERSQTTTSYWENRGRLAPNIETALLKQRERLLVLSLPVIHVVELEFL